MNDMRARLVVSADTAQVVSGMRQAAVVVDGVSRSATGLAGGLAKAGAASKTATRDLIDAVTGVSRSMGSAEKSADVFARALAEQEARFKSLKAAIDPAWRAEQQFKSAQLELNRSLKAGIVDGRGHSDLMGRLTTQYQRAAEEARRLEAGQTGMIRAVGGARGQIQNMSFQVADLATQIGAGTAASVAFGQQLPQMLGGLGAFGALAGAAVAIGVPLAASLFRGADGAKEMEKRSKELDASILRLSNSLDILADNTLEAKFGRMTGAMREMSETMVNLDRNAQLGALRKSLDGVLNAGDPAGWAGFGTRMRKALSDPGLANSPEGQARLREQADEAVFARLRSGTTYADFSARRGRIDEALGTGDVTRTLDEINGLLDALTSNGSLKTVNAELQAMLDALVGQGRAAAEIEAKFDKSAQSAAAYADMLGQATARQDELKRLIDVRADAEQRLADALSARDAVAATSARAVIAETERQIAATTDARIRIDALGTSLADIERIASVVSFDKDGKFRGALDLAKADLLAARKNVDDLNDAELSRLENAFHRIARAARDMAQATTGLGGGFGGMDLSGYADGLSATRAMIQKYEGWAPVAKWDENANRGGWGSSTVTLSDGSQRTLQKGETVNKADADRDLDRRIRGYFEEQQRVAGAAWAGFNPAQVAALASIQHNYGSLPDRIRPALQTGDAQIIAQAIAGLAMDYTRSEREAGKTGRPMNYNRRMGEAGAFGDAIGAREANEATLAAGEEAAREAKRKSDELERQRKADEDRRAREVKARADQDSRMRDSVTAELDKLAPSYQRAVAAADRWKAEALAGLDKTKAGYDAFAADIEAIYQQRIAKAREDDLARLDAWSAGIERGFAELEESAVSWSDVSEDLVTGWAKGGEEAFVNFVKTGKAELEDLLDFTLEQLARLAWQQAIQPGLNGLLQSAAGALGGFLGGGAGVTLPTAHTGGTGVMRTYSAGNRQRADERLAMLRDGERVMTPRMLENAGALVSSLAGLAGGRGDQPVLDTRPVVQVINQSSTQVDGRVRETRDERGGRQYQLVLSDAVASALTAPGGRASQTLRAQFGVTKKGTRR